MKGRMTKGVKNLFLCIAFALAAACSGSDGGTSMLNDDIGATPDFSPTSSENLSDLTVNTFKSSGIDISVTPDTVDFNDPEESGDAGEIAIDDDITVPFTLSNRSGGKRTFSFQFYAVSSGFSVLDSDEINLGTWDDIVLEDGASETFHAKFDATLFGTQTTYLAITSDVEGHIHLPMRAVVSGAADFRVIPTGYLCSNDDAPAVTFLDFGKTAYGRTETRGIKICNTGGEDFEVNSIAMMTADSEIRSNAFSGNAYEDFIWSVEDEINASFSSGLSPSYSRSFAEPQFIPYEGDGGDAASDYGAVINETGTQAENTVIAAGELLRLDVGFTPSIDIEAPEGSLYEPIERNAKMRVTTSLGIVDIPLVAATGGREPSLKLSYRLSDTETWREIDLDSDGSAIYFGSVEVFRDWVTDNFRAAEIKVENAGSGNKALEFYPKSLAGYFEYDSEDGSELEFPIVIPSGGDARSFEIRYLPTPHDVPEEAAWDFGQFYFEHTGGNGPQGKVALVGEQDDGDAVELKFGGSTLKREYGETESKNLCVMQIDDGVSPATDQAFTVLNNNGQYPLTVSWSVIQDADSDATFSATPSSGSFTVEPGSSASFTTGLLAAADASEGANTRGILTVTTNYPSEQESKYAAELADLEGRDFTVPFSAQASTTGLCALGGGKVVGKDAEGVTLATVVVDRISMVLTSLIEPTRNHPAFRFHLPLEIDYKKGRARVSESIPFIYDKNDPKFTPIYQFRSYAHQITNVKGCAPLPSNPYRLEFEKGSWTGDGFDCNEDGTISYAGKDGAETTINSDTACLPGNGGEEITVDGVRWVVFYHDFVKFDTSGCEMEYYGKVATFAYRPDVESFSDVFARSEANPNGSESDFEQIYGTFQFGSYLFFNKDFTCGSKTYKSGTTEEDPDGIKDCYAALAERNDGTRNDGFLNECSYFNFIIDKGLTPDDADSDSPNTDEWSGYGFYEPHVDADGNLYDTKYDITLYNIHAQVFALSPGDRVSFFRHPGKLLYTELNVTFTTKPVADPNAQSDWTDLVAVKARPNFDKNQVYLTDGDPYDVDQFWRDDGFNNQFSSAIDDAEMEPGVDYGGFGKGNFVNCPEGSGCDIVPSGWPVNFDENNLLILTGLGSFNGKGNTAPGFAKEDSSGKGKSLYFTLHGCLVEGVASEDQGCFTSKLDTTVMDHDSSADNDDTSVLDVYAQYGILPSGYPGDTSASGTSDCAAAAASDDIYRAMPCIDYKIFPMDRDRLTNYYDSSKFHYEKDYYGGSTCGYGM